MQHRSVDRRLTYCRSRSSSHSRKIGKAKLVRERLPMLRHTSEQISRELTHLPGLTLSTPP